MRPRLAITGLAAAATLLASMAASADVTLVSQQRRVSISLSGESICYAQFHPGCPTPTPVSPLDETFEAVAPDFDAFDQSFDEGYAHAAQQSTITPTRIEGSGSIGAVYGFIGWTTPEYLFDGFLELDTTALSRLETEFSVDTPTPYRLSGSWVVTVIAIPAATTRIELRDASDVVAAISCEQVPADNPACVWPEESIEGVLPPGTYTLEVVAFAAGDQPSESEGYADYTFRLELGPGTALPTIGPWMHGFVGALLLALGVIRARMVSGPGCPERA